MTVNELIEILKDLPGCFSVKTAGGEVLSVFMGGGHVYLKSEDVEQ